MQLKSHVILFFFASLTQANAPSSAPLLVNINGLVRLLEPTTSYEPAYWANNVENSLACYLMLHYDQVINKQITPAAVLTNCVTLGIGTQEALNRLVEKYTHTTCSWYELDEQSLHNLFICLGQDCLIIKHACLPDECSLLADGSLTSESLALFLEHCFHTNLINDADFQDASSLHIRALTDHYFTHQVFDVRGTNNNYIVREMTFGAEKVARLACGVATRELSPLIWPNNKPGYPQLFFPICYLSYEQNSQLHILAVIPKAWGKQLSEFMLDYKIDPSEITLAKAATAYYKSGQALSAWHHLFMNADDKVIGLSVTHGDMHHYHIFFDEQTDQVSIIDNEYVAYYFAHRRPATVDIINFFDETLGPSLTKPEFYQGFNKQAWIKATLEAFLEGYLCQYPAEKKALAIEEIRQAFIDKTDRWKEYYSNQTTFDAVFDTIKKQGRAR